MFVLGFLFGGFQLALLSAINEFQISEAMLGLPVASLFVAYSIMPLIFGSVSDRTGKKPIFLIFMIVFIAGCISVWFSGSTLQFLIGIFIIGTGSSVTECSLNASVSDVFKGEEEKYLNYTAGFGSAGAVAAPIILQALMDNLFVSWRFVFLICAVTMVVCVPALLLVRTSPAPHVRQLKQKYILDKPRLFFGFAVCLFIYVSVETCLSFFADAVFTLELNSPSLGALAISFYWGSMGIGRIVFGRLKKIPKNATEISFFCLAIVIIAIAFVRHDIIMLVLFLLSGFASSCIWPGVMNAAFSLNRNASGALISYLNLGVGIGGAVVPLAIGAIMDKVNMTVSFLLLTVISAIAGIYMLKNSRKALDTERET